MNGYKVVVQAQVISELCIWGIGGTFVSLLKDRVDIFQFQDNWGTYFSVCGEQVKSVSRILLLASKTVSPCSWMKLFLKAHLIAIVEICQ